MWRKAKFHNAAEERASNLKDEMGVLTLWRLKGQACKAGDYTRPRLSSISAVSDTKFKLNIPRCSLIPPGTSQTPPKQSLTAPISHMRSS